MLTLIFLPGASHRAEFCRKQNIVDVAYWRYEKLLHPKKSNPHSPIGIKAICVPFYKIFDIKSNRPELLLAKFSRIVEML